MSVDYSTPPTIQVFDSSLTMMTEISPEVYDYFRFTRNLRTAGDFELQINRNHPKAAYLLDASAFLIAYFDGVVSRAGIIEQTDCALDDTGASGEMLVITGRSGGMFSERLAVAGTSSDTGYDTQTGAAETLIRHYVEVNAISAQDASGNSAPQRNIPNLILETAPMTARGTSCMYSARYESLAEILEALSYAGGVGWDVEFERSTKSFIFHVIEGADHSASSPRPIIFRPELNNIESLEYLFSLLDSKTLAYVGGSGENASRVIESVYLSSTEPSGFNRRETFVDASNTADSAELTTAGQSELLQTAGSISLTASLNSSFTSVQYQVDYDLGDTVTVEYTGVATVDATIISIVDEIVGGDRGSVRRLTAKLGTEPADIRRIVRRTTRKTIEQLK